MQSLALPTHICFSCIKFGQVAPITLQHLHAQRSELGLVLFQSHKYTVAYATVNAEFSITHKQLFLCTKFGQDAPIILQHSVIHTHTQICTRPRSLSGSQIHRGIHHHQCNVQHYPQTSVFHAQNFEPMCHPCEFARQTHWNWAVCITTLVSALTWNRTRPRVVVHNEPTRELISTQKVTRTQPQRPESPTATLMWHRSKDKVHTLHQRYILQKGWRCGA